MGSANSDAARNAFDQVVDTQYPAMLAERQKMLGGIDLSQLGVTMSMSGTNAGLPSEGRGPLQR